MISLEVGEGLEVVRKVFTLGETRVGEHYGRFEIFMYVATLVGHYRKIYKIRFKNRG